MSEGVRPLDLAEVGSFDVETDVFVAGFGAAGCCVAHAARENGAEVLVAERASGAGGAAALSEGIVYLGGGTPVQIACGFEDSVDNMARYLLAACGPEPDEAKVVAYAEASLDHFDWLVERGVDYDARLDVETQMAPTGTEGLVWSGGEDAWPFNEIAVPAPRGHLAKTKRSTGWLSFCQGDDFSRKDRVGRIPPCDDLDRRRHERGGHNRRPARIRPGRGDQQCRRSEIATHEPRPQQPPAALQALLHGGCRHSEQPRRFVLRFAFQVTEHQGSTVALGKRAQFLVDYLLHLAPGDVIGHGCEAACGCHGLVFLSSAIVPPRFEGDPIRDAVQPARERRVLADCGSLLREDEKGGLEGVFRIRPVSHHVAADVVNHRSMPIHEDVERVFIAIRPEPAEELLVGEPFASLVFGRAAKQMQYGVYGVFHKETADYGTSRIIRYTIVPRPLRMGYIFWKKDENKAGPMIS